MMLFQYHFVWILLAFVLLHLSHLPSCYQNLLRFGSILPLFIGAHLAISQPFKIKSVTEICRVFDLHPPYLFDYREQMQEKFDLLCAFEDKTYFQRTRSYSCVSLEYFRCFLKNHDFPSRRFFKKAISGVRTSQGGCALFLRGYSTPEMQLIRTLGIARGYDKYKLQHKVFEVLYSKIIFSSLKEYHKANTYSSLEHYRHYLLFIYFQTVMTKINARRCMPLASAFQDPEDISAWSMEGLFAACLGLSFRLVTPYNLWLFSGVIEQFGLDKTRIESLSSSFPSPFPCRR